MNNDFNIKNKKIILLLMMFCGLFIHTTFALRRMGQVIFKDRTNLFLAYLLSEKIYDIVMSSDFKMQKIPHALCNTNGMTRGIHPIIGESKMIPPVRDQLKSRVPRLILITCSVLLTLVLRFFFTKS